MIPGFCKKIRLHCDANARTLGFARIYVFSIWFIYILSRDVASIGYLSSDLFMANGIMKFIPSEIIELITQPGALIFLKLVILYFIGCVILGVSQQRKNIWITVLLLTFYIGYMKGFGGHVDHRELVLLYISYFLAILPSFDALTISVENSVPRPVSVYQASMMSICLIIILNYVFIGLARLFVGFPEVFYPQVMEGWMVARTMRPNPYGFDITYWVLGSDLLRMLVLMLAMPISTLLEIALPIIIWSKSLLRYIFLAFLAVFHISIFVLMNISFVENMLLLLLLTNYTGIVEKCLTSNNGHGIVFYDGKCAMCNCFIRFAMRNDASGKLQYAPLYGKTFMQLNKELRENVSRDTILFYDLKKETMQQKSKAIFQIFSTLGHPWKCFGVFRFIPVFITDFMYDCVAKTRYKIFGIARVCSLPTFEERKKLLP